MNPPSFHKGTIFTQRGNGAFDTALWALHATDGTIKWSAPYDSHSNRSYSPAVSDLGIFATSDYPGDLYGFDIQSGARKFKSSLYISAEGTTPAIYHDRIYSLVEGTFRSHHPETGGVQWSLDLALGYMALYRTMCIDSEFAYFVNHSALGPELVCIDLGARKVAWKVAGNFNGTPATNNGAVYVCHGGVVKAYHAASGAWIADYTAAHEASLTRTPVVSNDLLFVSSSTKTHIIDLQTRATLQIIYCGAEIAIANDVLYLSCTDNKVRAYGRAAPMNNVPAALAVQAGILEGSEAVLKLEGADEDGESLRFVIRTLPSQGTLYQTTDGLTKGPVINVAPAQVANAAGRVIYQPPTNAFGSGVGAFTFTAHDRVTSSTAATVTINVAPVNDPPLAINDTVGLRPGEPLLNFRPQTNDRDPDGDTLLVTGFTQGAKGLVSHSADGSLQYMPNVGFLSGRDSFTYTIRDHAEIPSTATVDIYVGDTLGRRWPTFGGSAAHTGHISIRLGTEIFAPRWQVNLGNAAKQLAIADGRVYATLGIPVAVTLDSSTGGELWRVEFPAGTTINPPTWYEGRVYIQNGNYSASRLFALRDLDGATEWDSPFLAQYESYLAPAADASGVFINGGTNGGIYGFDPDTGTELFHASLEQYDRWTPTICNDGLFSFVKGKLRNHHVTTGETLGATDLGWLHSGTSMNRTTAAADGRIFLINDSVTIPAGDQELVSVDLAAHAVAWKVKHRFTGTPAVAHQTVFAISGSTSNAIRAYDALTGQELGVYSLPGADTGLAVQPIITNDAIIASSAAKTYIFDLATRTLRQTIPFGGNLSLAGESLYIASSDGNIRAYSVPDPMNNPPSALAQAVSTGEDTPFAITLQGTDADNDTLHFVITTLPSLGTLHQTTDGITLDATITSVPALVLDAGARVIYRPPSDRHGLAMSTFQFAASDGKATSTPATATIDVLPVNDAPVARADTRMVTPGQILSPVRVLVNDFDVDGDPLRITSFTQPSLGNVAQNPDGTLRYHAPSAPAEGATSFTYTIADSSGVTAEAGVAVTIAPVVDGAWPTFGNGPDHTGYSTSALGRSGWAQRWSYAAMGSNSSLQPPASAGGKVFVTFKDGTGSRLVALNAGNGSPVWSRGFASAHSMNPPSHHAGRVYVQRGNHASDTQIFAVNAGTGDTVWTTPHSAQWESYMAPAVSNDGVFVNGGSYGGLYGFSGEHGSQMFFLGMYQTSNWTPALLGSELYAFVAGALSRHDPATGAVVWSKSLGWGGSGHTMDRTIALHDRRAFLINDSPSSNSYVDEDLVCIHLDTRATVWLVNGDFTGTPAVSSDTVFAISGNVVQARTASDGILVGAYATPAGTYLQGQPVVTDDLVIASSPGNTFIFGRYDRALLATLNRGGHPAVVDDALIISSPSTATVSAWAAQPAITFSPDGGAFDLPVQVVIGAADPDTKIHYTVDGSAPDFTSPWLTSGSTVRMDWTGAIRAISVKGSSVSRIHSASFTIADSDHDGLADWWEMERFGSLAASTGGHDSDGDGISNAAEFAAGTDPFSTEDRLDILADTAQISSEDELIIRWNSKTGRLYVVEVSDDLATWTAATTVLVGTGAQMEQHLPTLGNQKMYGRIRVLHALTPP